MPTVIWFIDTKELFTEGTARHDQRKDTRQEKWQSGGLRKKWCFRWIPKERTGGGTEGRASSLLKRRGISLPLPSSIWSHWFAPRQLGTRSCYRIQIRQDRASEGLGYLCAMTRWIITWLDLGKHTRMLSELWELPSSWKPTPLRPKQGCRALTSEPSWPGPGPWIPPSLPLFPAPLPRILLHSFLPFSTNIYQAVSNYQAL